MSIQVHTASTAGTASLPEQSSVNDDKNSGGLPNPTLDQTKPPEKEPLADRLDLLSRKERAIYRESQRVAQEKKSLAAERAEYEKFKSAKQGAKKNPLDYLSEAGLSYDELTQFVLSGGKSNEPDELEALRNEFKALKEERAKEKTDAQKAQESAQKQAEIQAIDGFKEQITEFVEQNKSTYELASMRDATDDIFATINEAFIISLNEWKRAGSRSAKPAPMTIKEAADIVEDFYEKEVMRLNESEKIKNKRNPPQEPARPKEPSKTLTNNMSSTAASLVPAKNDNDRMRRALEKLG